jgi:hypothetical protein
MVIGSLRPRKRDTWHTTLSLAHIREKGEKAVDLMKMYARLSLLEMKRMTRVLEATLLQTKRKLISMCFVQAWNAGLVDK